MLCRLNFLGDESLHYRGSIGRWMPGDAFYYICKSLCLAMSAPDSLNPYRCVTKARSWTRTRTTGTARRELNLRERERLWVSNVYGCDGNGLLWIGAIFINTV